jgi:hypothetical protein
LQLDQVTRVLKYLKSRNKTINGVLADPILFEEIGKMDLTYIAKIIKIKDNKTFF